MERIDHEKNLSFGTIFKLLLTSHYICLAPFMVLMVFWIFHGTGTMTVNGVQVDREEAERVSIELAFILPFILALLSAVEIKTSQSGNKRFSRAIVVRPVFMPKTMLRLGYWLLSRVTTPTIAYTKNGRDE